MERKRIDRRAVMSNAYVIQWKSKVNGRAGRGTKAFSQEEAFRLVEELNSEYPQIEHQAVHAPPPDETAADPPPVETPRSQLPHPEPELPENPSPNGSGAEVPKPAASFSLSE
jgi:hypothetical protein